MSAELSTGSTGSGAQMTPQPSGPSDTSNAFPSSSSISPSSANATARPPSKPSWAQTGSRIVALEQSSQYGLRAFNGSFAIDIPPSSPMLDLEDYDQLRNIVYDEDKGYWTIVDSRRGSMFTLSWVGMDYTLNGFAEWIDPSTVSNGTVLANNERHQGIPGGPSMQNASVEPGNTLGTMEDLELAARFIEFHSSIGSTIGFHNASVQLPIRTQA